MFMRGSAPSLWDSKTTSYFDRPHAHISRHPSDDSYTSTTSPTMNMTRKRPRVDSSRHSYARTPRQSASTYDLTASTSTFGLASPSPLVNTDYRLSGGMDTPGTWSEQRDERACADDAERDHRPNRYRGPSDHSYFPDRAIARNSRHESSTDMTASTTLSGWHLRRTAWALTGGLAGTIINFCWTTAFRGFHAGGGRAYTIHDADDTDFAQDRHQFAPTKSSRLSQSTRNKSAANPFQPPQPIENEPYRDRHHDPQRPIKTPVSHQRYLAAEDSAVRNNWVFVETTPTSPEERSPVRKRSRASVAGSSLSQNYSHILQPTVNATSRTYTASFASPRANTTSTSKYTHSRSHSYNPIYNNNNLTTIPSPSMTPKSKRPRVSMPSSPSLLTSPTKKLSYTTATASLPHSPISPEIDLFRRKRRKDAKRNDQSLKRLNATLQGMIREGQEALGSRIEIVDGGGGDGGVSDSGGESGSNTDGDDDCDMDGSYFRGSTRWER